MSSKFAGSSAELTCFVPTRELPSGHRALEGGINYRQRCVARERCRDGVAGFDLALLFSGENLPKTDRLVPAHGNKLTAVGRERQRQNGLRVARQLRGLFTRCDLEDTNRGTVFAVFAKEIHRPSCEL